jgi:uncharacterized membrane protein
MKKIIFALFTVLISFSSFAQLAVSTDTALYTGARGYSAVVPITITNSKSVDVPVTWSIDIANCVIPTGFTVTGVCFLPSGSCYPYTTASHTDLAKGNSTQVLDLNIIIGANARLDSNCVIVLNTDLTGHNKLVYVVNAVNWATGVNTRPTRIKLEMYPQPSTSILNIVHNDSRVAKAVVYSLLGKKIQEYNTPVNAAGFSIPVEDLSNGVYFIDIRDAANNSLATQKFTKE